jgi:hypothetical protein
METPQTPNPFADEPQAQGVIRLQSAADPLDPYAAPAGEAEYFESLGPGVGIWRQDFEIVMHRLADFPPRCVLTNEPTDDLQIRRLAWGHPFDIGLTQRHHVRYAISAAAMRGLGHHRILAIGVAIVSFLVSCVLLVVLFEKQMPLLVAPIGIMLLLFVGSCKIAVDARRPLKIVARGGEYLWLFGAGPAFLLSLPRWPRQKDFRP